MRQAREIARLASGGALHVSGPEALPILFLHGVAGGAWSWEPQVAALERNARCYAWEARGHGLAAAVADAGLGDYFVDALEALAYAVCERRRPALLAGHSMGGLLALALAAERPGDVAGLFLVEPVYAPGGGGHLDGWLGRVAKRAMAPLAASFERDGRLARVLGRAVFARSFADRDAMERAWRAQRTQVPAEYPRMLYEAFDGPTGFPNRAFAGEVTQPTTLVEGTAARGGARFPELVDSLRAGLADRFHYAVLDGGHYLQLDRPRAVTGLLEEAAARCR